MINLDTRRHGSCPHEPSKSTTYAALPPLTPPKIGGEPIQNISQLSWLLAPLLDKEGLGVVARSRQVCD
jgi:hypothetical protein